MIGCGIFGTLVYRTEDLRITRRRFSDTPIFFTRAILDDRPAIAFTEHGRAVLDFDAECGFSRAQLIAICSGINGLPDSPAVAVVLPKGCSSRLQLENYGFVPR